MGLAGLDPLLHRLRSGIPEVVEIHGLGLGNNVGRPFSIGAAFQPLLGVVFPGDFEGIEPLGTELSATKVPAGFDGHPSAMVQGADVNAMADIPTAIAVVVLHSLGHRRVVVAIHTLDDAVRIFAANGLGGHIEKQLHILAEHEPVGLGTGGGEWFVDEGNEHTAGMRTHEPLHRGRLPYALVKLIAPDGAEEWQIGLEHQPQAVAGLIHFALHRVLGEPEKIQIRELGEEDVVMELLEVAPKDTQVEMAHRVRSTESDFAPVEAEFSFRRRGFLLLEPSHSKLTACRVKHRAGGIEQFDLGLIQPRGFEIPKSRLLDGQGEREIVFSRPHQGRLGLRRAVVEVAKSSHPLADGAMQVLVMNEVVEIPA